MSKHAKAPWAMGGNDGSFVDIDSPDHGALAKVVWCMNDDKNAGRSSPDCEANARLIAAAPDLLAAAIHALEDAVADDMDDWFGELRAAVAKATGADK